MGAAGYSGTPLPKKLGIKPGSKVHLVGAPEGYLGLAENGRIKLRVLSTSASDAVDVEQDPAEAFAMDAFQVEFIEAQSSWVRYRITPAGGGGPGGEEPK